MNSIDDSFEIVLPGLQIEWPLCGFCESVSGDSTKVSFDIYFKYHCEQIVAKNSTGSILHVSKKNQRNKFNFVQYVFGCLFAMPHSVLWNFYYALFHQVLF